jgi:ABC-type transport system involved in cytochrome bd biosynthesis fused ATPase/permease subunit
MTWILRLYPRPWRRRYGDEVAAMLEGRGFSFGTAVDLIAGAIDVWLHPSATMAALGASEEREKNMTNGIAKWSCAALAAPNLTRADAWRAAGVTIGLTVVLTLAWMAVHVRVGDNPYTDSLSMMPIVVSYLFSMRYTYLKNRNLAVQAAFIGGFSGIVAAILLGAGWISTLI